MKKSIYSLLFVILMLNNFSCFSREVNSMPNEWTPLNNIMVSRLVQTKLKMKLTKQQTRSLIIYLQTLNSQKFVHLQALQTVLPKTTLELLFAVQSRGLNKKEAERIAEYLKELLEDCRFKNQSAFDENTSHIIGREWHEIDYSGEGMTWQNQKAKYAPHGVANFKSLDNLQRFFVVESRLPYFKRIYQPQDGTIKCTKLKKPHYSFVRMSAEPRVINALPYDSKIKEEQHWQHFAKNLDKNTSAQLRTLVSNFHINIDYINHIVKVSDEEYLISITFPYMAKGFYQARLPANLSEAPWISKDRLVFASEVVEILKSEKSGIWLLAKGSGMRRGIGYEEFALVNIQDPKQSMVLMNGDSVSEEIDIKKANEEHGIEKILQEIKYEITKEGKIKFNIVETNVKTGLDSMLSYIVEENDKGIKICAVNSDEVC